MDRKILILSLVATVGLAGDAAAPAKVRTAPAARERVTDATFRAPVVKEVLDQEEVAPGMVKRTVRDSYGRVYRDLVRDGVAPEVPAIGASSLRRGAEYPNASLYEAFEGWDEVDRDWIPVGWTEINTPGNIPTDYMKSIWVNNTWRTFYAGDGYWTAISKNGGNECFIHFTYTGSYMDADGNEVPLKASPQDEWLISPYFTLKEHHKLFFEVEADLSSVYEYDYQTRKWDFSSPVCDMEVLARVQGDENWVSVWKLSANKVANMTEEELRSDFLKLRYFNESADLSQFSGKIIQIAFRHTNTSTAEHMVGNSMALDGILVDAPQAQAAYELPQGYLLGEFTKDFWAAGNSYLMMPAYRPVTWANASNTFSESYEWRVYSPQGDSTAVVTTDALELTYPWSQGKVYPYPELTASNAFSSSKYSFDMNDEAKGGLVAGGSLPLLQEQAVSVSNVDYQHKGLITSYIDNEGGVVSYVYGTHKAGAWGQGMKQLGVCAEFKEPSAGFDVDEMVVTLGALDADQDAELTLTVWEMDNYGYLSSTPMATATAKISDAFYEQDAKLYNLPFKFPAGFCYDRRILVELGGYADNSKIRTLGVAAQYYHNDTPEQNTAYMRFQFDDNGDVYNRVLAAKDVLKDYSNTLFFGMLGSFHFIHPEQDVVELCKDGGSVEVDVTADADPADWCVAKGSQLLPLTAPVDFDWFKVSLAADGQRKIRIEVQPTEELRQKNVTLAYKGARNKLTVKQNTNGGVSGLESVSTRVWAQGSEVTVSGAPAGSVVTVYTVDGRVASTARADYDGAARITVNAKGVVIVSVAGKAFKLVM